jgi:hypothetical protein
MKKLSLLFCLVNLSGCSTYSETFDCSPGTGVGCKSLNQVNKMVEKGHLPYREEEDISVVTTIPDRTLPPRDGPVTLTAEAVPTQRVWFTPRRDSYGHYVDLATGR